MSGSIEGGLEPPAARAVAGLRHMYEGERTKNSLLADRCHELTERNDVLEATIVDLRNTVDHLRASTRAKNLSEIDDWKALVASLQGDRTELQGEVDVLNLRISEMEKKEEEWRREKEVEEEAKLCAQETFAAYPSGGSYFSSICGPFTILRDLVSGLLIVLQNPYRHYGHQEVYKEEPPLPLIV
mmetsp:Transcript_13209/g.26256  ORF Transcript_13209/g.26256 Transcript_13209/m.26256 type:complete len:185 (-) Transcript_13209:44-598(-)|eukprot:CAMPEP_0182463822 /NCGR_PEP_ID=MMETSP1319-20130603/7988_1 /TAXON_ID=172717 /ORGANISM="Bolidomonas pacifica, Strain RCC208" /LENGTH=184 /DNA_ID=CAMNT_0024663409 /DNA_START=26 /DNA_END=580 /DNA_ORIENTATION=+